MRRHGGAGLRVLNLGGETVDTKSATGKLILTIFAELQSLQRCRPWQMTGVDVKRPYAD